MASAVFPSSLVAMLLTSTVVCCFQAAGGVWSQVFSDWSSLTTATCLVVWSFHVIPRKPRSSIRRGDCLSFHMCYVLVVTKRVLTLSGKAFWLMLELTDLLLNFRTPYLSAYIENFFLFFLKIWDCGRRKFIEQFVIQAENNQSYGFRSVRLHATLAS